MFLLRSLTYKDLEEDHGLIARLYKSEEKTLTIHMTIHYIFNIKNMTSSYTPTDKASSTPCAPYITLSGPVQRKIQLDGTSKNL